MQVARPIEPFERGEPRDTGAVLVRMDQIETKPIDWLWSNRIPRGALTLVTGNGGVGKTALILDIIARASNCKEWPDGAPAAKEPVGALIVTDEDRFAQTIKPRLEAAGADPRYIQGLKGVRRGDHETFEDVFRLDLDLEELRKAVGCVPNCGLVMIDPISGHLGRVGENENAEVRRVLSPLTKLAGELGFAVIGLGHLNKNSGYASAQYRALGSIAFVAAARMAWLVDKDPSHPDTRRMLPLKANLVKEPSGLSYQLESHEEFDVPVVRWDPRPLALSADEAMSQAPIDRSQAPELKSAVEFLGEILADGAMPAKEVFDLAKQEGISEKTLRRAKGEAGVKSEREGFGPGSKMLWSLPGMPAEIACPDTFDDGVANDAG